MCWAIKSGTALVESGVKWHLHISDLKAQGLRIHFRLANGFDAQQVTELV